MTRTTTLTPEQVPAESSATLNAFTKSLGFTPNMMAAFAQSPLPSMHGRRCWAP